MEASNKEHIKKLHKEWSASLKLDRPGISDVQRLEMERSFYSGALGIFTLLTADAQNRKKGETLQMINDIQVELFAYLVILQAAASKKAKNEFHHP